MYRSSAHDHAYIAVIGSVHCLVWGIYKCVSLGSQPCCFVIKRYDPSPTWGAITHEALFIHKLLSHRRWKKEKKKNPIFLCAIFMYRKPHFSAHVCSIVSVVIRNIRGSVCKHRAWFTFVFQRIVITSYVLISMILILVYWQVLWLHTLSLKNKIMFTQMYIKLTMYKVGGRFFNRKKRRFLPDVLSFSNN